MWKHADPSAEEGAETACLANRAKALDVAEEPDIGCRDLLVKETQRSRLGFARSRLPTRNSRRIAVGGSHLHKRVARRGDAQCHAGAREVDHQCTALDRRDAPYAELGIEAMSKVVPCCPGHANRRYSSGMRPLFCASHPSKV